MSDPADQFIHAVHESEIERLQQQIEERDKEIAKLREQLEDRESESRSLIADRDEANRVAAQWQRCAAESCKQLYWPNPPAASLLQQTAVETELENLAKQIFVQNWRLSSNSPTDPFEAAQSFLAWRDLLRKEKERKEKEKCNGE